MTHPIIKERDGSASDPVGEQEDGDLKLGYSDIPSHLTPEAREVLHRNSAVLATLTRTICD
jgi:hypothetical protein